MHADESKSKGVGSLSPVPGIYALGDVCANPEAPLPALAQARDQNGIIVSIIPSNGTQPVISAGPRVIFKEGCGKRYDMLRESRAILVCHRLQSSRVNGWPRS